MFVLRSHGPEGDDIPEYPSPDCREASESEVMENDDEMEPSDSGAACSVGSPKANPALEVLRQAAEAGLLQRSPGGGVQARLLIAFSHGTRCGKA